MKENVEKTAEEKLEVKEIPFNGNTLLGAKTPNGEVWLAVRKVCLDIGLSEGQARRQIANIQEEEPLKFNSRIYATVQKEGKREVKRSQLFLNEKYVGLWLAKISLTPFVKKNNPDAYRTLIKYQDEAANVLHKAFYETEEQKESFHQSLGIEGEIHELKQEFTTLSKKINFIVDNSTINMTQQKILFNTAKKRVCSLLGGKKSKEYKRDSKLYFQNLWGDVKRRFQCSGSYHDLNPRDYFKALDFISQWEFYSR